MFLGSNWGIWTRRMNYKVGEKIGSERVMINSMNSKLQLAGSVVSQRVSKNLLKFSKEKFIVPHMGWSNPCNRPGICIEKNFGILMIV